MRVLGIDPGSLVTGYGIVESSGRGEVIHVCHGRITCGPNLALEERLKRIFEGLRGIISSHSPEVMAVEKVFVARNVSSALKLGHVRGIVILSAVEEGLKVFQYTPMEVKKAVTGYGRAEKGQIRSMVSRFLGIPVEDGDAGDALAVALCHLYREGFRRRVEDRVKEVR